jgi:ATP-binding cassette subfamily B protein
MIEPVPDDLKASIKTFLETDEEELIRIPSDLNAEGYYGVQWVVVTEKRVLIYPDKTTQNPTEISVSEIAKAQTEALVGGGHLVIERHGQPTVTVFYSNSEAERFSEVVRGLEQLRKKEPFLIRSELDRTRCETCGRLLPEKNSLCPACVRRFATLGRIVGYLKPYKGRAILMASASIIMTFSELIPPLISRRIVDEVFVPKKGAPATVDERVVLLGFLVLGLIGVRVMSWSMDLMRGWIVGWLSARMTADIRSQLYRRLEMLSL